MFDYGYSKPRTVSKDQAHRIADIAATTCIKGKIHQMIDFVKGDLIAQQTNKEWKITCGTLVLCYLREDIAENTVDTVCAA